MAKNTAGTYHFHDADCKLLGMDFCFSGPVSLCCHIYALRLLGISVAKMGKECRPSSALKLILDLPEPGSAVNEVNNFSLYDEQS